MTQQVGFIGLGTMGFPLCRNLAQSGVPVVAYDAHPRPDRVAALIGTGVHVVNALPEVAEGRDVIFAILPDADVAEAVLLDPAFLALVRPGTICVDMTSGYPRTTLRIGQALAQRGVRLIDSPVCNGGPAGAESRQTVVCVGGDAADLDAVRPLLERITSKIFHVGPLGAGHAMKIVNNSFAFVYAAGIAEGLALGAAYGFDLSEMIGVLQHCSAGTPQFNAIAPRLVESPAENVSFQLKLATKDLRYATALAGELRVPHLTTDAAHGVYELATRIVGPGAEALHGPWRLLQRTGAMERREDI